MSNSADELYESATGAKNTLKDSGGPKRSVISNVKTGAGMLFTAMKKHAPDVKRGVDNLVAGSQRETTAPKRNAKQTVKNTKPKTRPQQSNSGFDIMNSFNMGGGNMPALFGNTPASRPTAKKAGKKHKSGKSADGKNIHIHIHK